MAMTVAGKAAPAKIATPKKATGPSLPPMPNMQNMNAAQNPQGFNAGILNNGVSSPAMKASAAHGQLTGQVAQAPGAPNTGANTGLGISGTGSVAPYSSSGAGGGGDGTYLDATGMDAQQAAQAEYEQLLAELAQQRTNYEQDTNNTFRNLGFDPNSKQWNQNDKLTGYGQAFQNQQGDFAARGMLDSSLYGSSLNDLNRGFQQQADDVQNALAQFIASQEQQKSAAGGGLQAALVEAQRQAAARMAAGL